MPRFFRATRKISLFAAALLCGGFTANAATYYVSQSTGDDSLDGLAAAKAGAKGPWKTLAKASIEYKPGDSILLKRGDTWNEEFTPKGSGTPERPILISSYGQGNKPLIDREDYKQDRTGSWASTTWPA